MHSPSAPPPPSSDSGLAPVQVELTSETPLLINIHEKVLFNYDKKVENEDKNSCIICLEEKDDSNKSIISINEISFLNKSCSCHFFIHEKCFNLWFFKNPKCPICSSGLSYNEIIIPMHYRNINNDDILSFNDDRVSYIKFLKNVTLLLIFLTFLSFISFYLYPFNQ